MGKRERERERERERDGCPTFIVYLMFCDCKCYVALPEGPWVGLRWYDCFFVIILSFFTLVEVKNLDCLLLRSLRCGVKCNSIL